MKFQSVFSGSKPLIAVLHLPALPGSPNWKGDLKSVYDFALREAALYDQSGVDAIIIENFNDAPFFPAAVPAVTVAAMSAIAREVICSVKVPVGINVLRNDAAAALSIAAATGAKFIRVNVHTGAMVTDQGIIEGKAYETLRLRAAMKAEEILILADVHVKHAAPLAIRSIADETQDLVGRGLADAVIVSGTGTGAEIDPLDLQTVRKASTVPVFTGSGVTRKNLGTYFPLADGFIVGSTFKENGNARNAVEAKRVEEFVTFLRSLRSK